MSKNIFFYQLSIIKSPLSPLTYQSNKKLSKGDIVITILKNKEVKAVVIDQIKQPAFKCLDIINTTNLYFDEKELILAQFISNYYLCSLGEALSLFTPFDKTIKPITNKKIDIKLHNKLSTIQLQAKNFINTHTTSLLFADTGSGKTEIYIHIIQELISKNKQVLFLMPEISLTPQMEKRLKNVFGDIVAIWHSKITKKTKQNIINNLLHGDIKLIAGARSALFLPYYNLELIIVDEEHDDAYKAQQKPKINVKDLSSYYASKFNIKTILGSATPSLNSYYKFPYFRIKGNFYNTQQNHLFFNNSNILNQDILNQIKKTLNQNKQVIIFLPTRANYKYQICDNCGASLECPFCSISMSLYIDNRFLKCNYCNFTQPIISECPYCAKKNKHGILKNYRIGTSEITQSLQKEFPNNNIVQFDRDHITTHSKLKKVLKEFDKHKIDILVGTQMLSKGHDYPNVSLVIIISIDSILKMNDYRAREKALSLYKQIAGRSGRKYHGKVIIQTNNKDFFTMYDDYQEFLNDEIEYRKELYPPFVKFAKITFTHKNSQKANQAMMQMYNNLQQLKLNTKYKNIDIVGYGQSHIFKISNKFNFEILLRSKNIKLMLEAILYTKNDLAIIDIDPI